MLNIFLCHYCSHRSSCAVWAALHQSSSVHQVLSVVCLCNFLECSTASMKKRSLWYVKPKIHVDSHILHHGCNHEKIKHYSCALYKILNAQSEIELSNLSN
jgi:hypothetical protein